MVKEKVNILLVDDEEALLDSIKRRLQIRDFNVIAVNRGDKALEVARLHPIDVALVDLKMPGMSGEDVLLHLKKDYPWMEVVIITGHGSFDPENESVYNQAYSYLGKPCDLETLLRVLVEAYKKTVMNRLRISPEEMEEILVRDGLKTPREVLKKIKEMDQHGGDKSPSLNDPA
ncbi:MAG: response regulator [Deltaproteobacteria bacterium]|nr:response regulator [Deltaproteobacteria bacterium]